MKICKHFGECGGCSFQDVPYEEQLRKKTKKIKELLFSYGLTTELKPINYYQQWHYRNKMEFTFSKDEKIICGMHAKYAKRRVIDIEQCLIFSPDAKEILRNIKEFVRKKNYSIYNKFSHQGFLRHLIIREAKFTKEIMVAIVTSSINQLDKEEFIKSLVSLKLQSKVKSIYWIINDALGDAVTFENKNLLYGEPNICEELDSFKFNIAIDSFFQINPSGIKNLYTKIRDYAQLKGNERILDLYCGVGCIGIFLAAGAKFVWGIEIKKEIVDAAFCNAELNNIKNISFLTSDVRRFLSSQSTFYKDIDILMINPPRSGLSKKIIRGILRLNPKLIFYSSCNPDSLLGDIKELAPNYRLDFIEPFDFFPHTPHLECLALLGH